MSRIVTIAIALGALVIAVLAGTPAAASPSSYETAWTNAMNQASYWDAVFANDSRTVICSKYEGHSGYIPASYDAAVIKNGSDVVRVYPDLTTTGAFTAQGAINPANGEPFAPPHSWVMKCTFTPVSTTTSSTSTTSSTLPESTTTDSTTTTSSTLPESTTTDSTTTTSTLPESTTTDSTTTTSSTLPESTTTDTTTTTVDQLPPPDSTTTTSSTLPGSTTTDSTTTTVEQLPPPGPTTTVAGATGGGTPRGQLPATGGTPATTLVLAFLAMAFGTVIVRLSRRNA
jgi:LPXTG-motif cell wall-anchored protein